MNLVTAVALLGISAALVRTEWRISLAPLAGCVAVSINTVFFRCDLQFKCAVQL